MPPPPWTAIPWPDRGWPAKRSALPPPGSFLGSVIGLIMLAFFTPLIGNFALKFKSFEFFWLAIFGIVICGNLTAPKDPLKGWIAGFLGLFDRNDRNGAQSRLSAVFVRYREPVRRHQPDPGHGRRFRTLPKSSR